MRVLSEKDNPDYVTKAECVQISGSINDELKTIKKALVGEDMRGGLVKDVADIKNTLNDQKQERELSARWKAAIYGASITSAGLVIAEAIKLVASLL